MTTRYNDNGASKTQRHAIKLLSVCLLIPMFGCAGILKTLNGGSDAKAAPAKKQRLSGPRSERKEELGRYNLSVYGLSSANCRKFAPAEMHRALSSSSHVLLKLAKDLDSFTNGKNGIRSWAGTTDPEKLHAGVTKFRDLLKVNRGELAALLGCGWQVNETRARSTWAQRNVDETTEAVEAIDAVLAGLDASRDKAIAASKKRGAHAAYRDGVHTARKNAKKDTCKGHSHRLFFAYETLAGDTEYYFCDGASLTKRAKGGKLGYSSGSLDNHPKFKGYIHSQSVDLDGARRLVKKLGTSAAKRQEKKASAAYSKRVGRFIKKYKLGREHRARAVKKSRLKVHRPRS